MKRSTRDDRFPSVNPAWRIAIIRSAWYPHCVEALTEDARKALVEAGIEPEQITVLEAPGSFELPLLAKRAIEHHSVVGVIAFGVIVEGETHHAALIAHAAARGIMDVQLQMNTPIAFEVLYVDDLKLAEARSIGKGGKGREAAVSLLKSLANKAELMR